MAEMKEIDQLQELREENLRLKDQVKYYEQDQIAQVSKGISDLKQEVNALSGKVDKILYAVIISLVGIAGLVIESLT